MSNLLNHIYLCGQNEIIFGQSSDGVRGELDFHSSPAD